MNWTRIAMGGVAAGIATWFSDFFFHGIVMRDTYIRLKEVFTQTESNPAWFLLVSVTICTLMAALFARTRGSWPSGVKGGILFGLYAGLMMSFQGFYNPLVIDGFPYYLAWCQGGISVIDALLAGAVLGAIIKS